ncbi:MAG: hypothetical protein ACI8VT_001859 [Saprospiraceae bacterium]|jgi:hypothetical protein
MKKTILLFSLIAFVTLSSCGKEDELKNKKDDDKTEKEGNNEEDDLELCEWDEATEASGSNFEKFIVKELEYSEDCDCYLSGMEKFLENGKTKYLIYYKSEDCVGYGYKVTCIDGDCEKDAEKCKFLQGCNGN